MSQEINVRPVRNESTETLEDVYPRQGFFRRFLRQPLAVAAAALLGVLVCVAFTADALTPQDPAATALGESLQGPSSVHLLGTDDLGRDVLSRLIVGTQTSLLAALLAVGVALVVGLPLGLVAGYFGRWSDAVIMRLNDAVMSFPALMLAVVVVGVLGPSLRNAMVAIGFVYAPRIMRLVRGSTIAVTQENYIFASRITGARDTWTIARHVLPNILSPLTVETTVMLGTAILAEASLSFLGLGVQPPTPSWGAMLGRAFPNMQLNPVPIIATGALISLTVLAFNLIGEGLRDSLGVERKARP